MNLTDPTRLRPQRQARERSEASSPRLRPALLAPYRELATLRYDDPLVLVEGDPEGAFVRSLSALVDALLREIAPPGAAGERLRQHVLSLEARVRALVAAGARGSLSELWGLAARELRAESEEASAALLEEDLQRAREALTAEGRVVDCTDDLPGVLLRHAWTTLHGQRVRGPLAEIAELAAKLSEILRGDFLRSAEARSPQRLEASVGTRYRDAFDFGAWSRLLEEGPPQPRLSESRRRRIRSTLAVLESQRFLALPDAAGAGAEPAAMHCFVFESCDDALEAFRERIPALVELVKAIAIAELESEDRYREPEHDVFFRHFDETRLQPEDLAHLPPYLVCLRAKDCTAQERARVLELLASGLPMKVLVQSDDLLADVSLLDAGATPGAGGAQLAGMALALGDAYVLQAASASLYRLRERIAEGLRHPGPTLFSVYTGSAEKLPDLPAYLRSAIATQGRVFPGFSFDPAAGDDWGSRLRLEDNPQPAADWPLDRLAYEDEALQRVCEEVAFTFVDFAAADARHARHLSPVPRADWGDDMVSVQQYLELGEEQARGKLPYVWLVDEDDVLQRCAVDRVMMRGARRCNDAWRRLQELCGLGDGRLPPPLDEQAVAAPSEQVTQEASAPPAASGAGEAALVAGEATAPGGEASRDADDPYIETPRCTTCDECTQRNPRMFAYDENKQAYIRDPDAGTFRDLVEAAESCQVCIIHPGKPRNPQEPGLDELIERAAAFR